LFIGTFLKICNIYTFRVSNSRYISLFNSINNRTKIANCRITLQVDWTGVFQLTFAIFLTLILICVTVNIVDYPNN